jgi:hypothetical protein
MNTQKNNALVGSDAARKVEALLLKKTITREDVFAMAEQERSLFFKKVNKIMNVLEGEERDAFWEKIELVVTPETRNRLWEHNHAKITVAISSLMQRYGRTPNKEEVSEESGLSRQTVTKHMKEYK